MRLDEFKRINLRVIKDEVVIYEGAAEELPLELKNLQTKQITIQPNLAITVVEDVFENFENED